MAKCLRCGATEEWIQGRTAKELRVVNGDQDRAAELERVLQRVQKALADTSPVLWKSLKKAVNKVLTPVDGGVES
jgi:enoyl-CoA hydratase/carnithine racemase